MEHKSKRIYLKIGLDPFGLKIFKDNEDEMHTEELRLSL